MSFLTFKTMTAPNGLPGWRVLAGAKVLGTIFNAGPSAIDANTWQGVAADGTRYTAPSKPKIAQRLLNHAALLKVSL